MEFLACVEHAKAIHGFVVEAEREIKDIFAAARNYDFVRKAAVLVTVLGKMVNWNNINVNTRSKNAFSGDPFWVPGETERSYSVVKEWSLK